MEKMKFEEEWSFLNPYQMTAVLDESPACVVNANVGSGKTTVLIAKILYLYQVKQIQPEEMIVLTFTNKAADEIKERLIAKEKFLKKEKNDEEPRLDGFGTFHSVALWMLREKLEVEKAGWRKDFTVMAPDEEEDLALTLTAEYGLKIKYKNRLKKRLEQEYQWYLEGRPIPRYKDDLFKLYPIIESEKKKQNKMTFSDLLRVSTLLLKEQDAFIPKWIIVDEVQDSDKMQMEFLEALKGRETKLFAVGDPNQVIYSWCGTGENMFFLLKHRFEAKEYSLPVNYRSNALILGAANRFLQFGSQIRASREKGEKVKIVNYYDPFQEAEELALRIRELKEQGLTYREMAVFYRLQRQVDVLAKVFERQGIPYEVSVKKSLHDIPVLNWFVRVLRFCVNPLDEQSGIAAVADKEFGEFGMTRKKAEKIIKEKKLSESLLYEQMAGFQAWVVDNFGKFMKEGEKEQKIFEYFHLKEFLRPTVESYTENVKKIKSFLKQLCSYCGSIDFRGHLREFLNSSELYGLKMEAGEKEVGAEMNPEDRKDAVQLMTLHASKGLEFDTVFLIGVNPGLIPLHSKNYEQEEEERRLFFVGITRAKNRLELSWYTNPGEPGIAGEESRYLKMIPQELLEGMPDEKERWANLQQLKKEVQEKAQEKAQEKVQEKAQKEVQEKEQKELRQEVKPEDQQEQADMRAGIQAVVQVRHPKYGVGVLRSEDDLMVEAEFDGYGVKQFLKAFGEVEIIG